MTKNVKDEVLKGVAGGGDGPASEIDERRADYLDQQINPTPGSGGGVGNTGMNSTGGSTGGADAL